MNVVEQPEFISDNHSTAYSNLIDTIHIIIADGHWKEISEAPHLNSEGAC